MTDLDRSVAEGHYARKQLFSGSRLIAWSHRRRFETGLRLARRYAKNRLLDLGCGDGTFLALLMRGTPRPQRAVGAEISDHLIDDCRTRLRHVEGVRFIRTGELDRPEYREAFDTITCMEVLEHVVEVDDVLDRLKRLLAAGGTLIVSVPAEIGPAILVKQSARRLAGWCGIGDYPGTSPYTWPQLARAVVAGGSPHLERPVHRAGDGSPFHDHKGFNWRVLRQKLAARLAIEAVHSSPVSWLPPWFASQVWFVARKPAPRQP